MNSEYDKLEDMLYELSDMIENSKSGLFSKGFDKERALELIDIIRESLPSEIRQAQKICDNSDRIIEDANNKAKNIIKDAEVDAERMVSNHEITKQAKEESERIREDAKNYLREMKKSALYYTENCITKCMNSINESIEIFVSQSKETEKILTDEVNTMYNNIQDLRSNKDNI